jgi:hypothetical protein
MPKPAPTLAVWIACFFVLLHCVLNLVVGLLEIAYGAWRWAVPPPPNSLTPLLDPFYAGLLNVLLAALLGWCQYAAVRNRSRGRSYLVGGLYCVWGVLICMEPWDTPWDAIHYVLAGTVLFVAVSMVRWGRQLARR